MTPENTVQEEKVSDKQLNFRALEAKYERALEQERNARLEAEKVANDYRIKAPQHDEEEDDDDEPYVVKKKLEKKFQNFGKSTQNNIQKAMEDAKHAAKEELKQELWLESHGDFYNVLKLADKFAEKSPKLAESILRMPDNFERQKLVYENIKAMEIDKPERKSNIQETIDNNKRSPFYQPSGVATSPHSPAGDYSKQGQKDAYDKMQQLKQKLRLG